MTDVVYVTLNGLDLVWLKGEDGSGALAYPEHIDEDGDVRMEAVFKDSYAHVFEDGEIFRYNERIGSRHDLKMRDAQMKNAPENGAGGESSEPT
jgi:hypothetical protein